MKRFFVCPAVILLALAVCCRPDDDIVKPNENSHAYCEALRKAGVPVKEIPHETGGHNWGQWQDFPASMFEWIASFHAE